MSSATTYLIVGANRGIGKALVTLYLSSPGNTVIATVRDASHPSAQSLKDHPKGQGSVLIIVQMDVSSPTSIADAVDSLSSVHHIQHLDVVIANAGIGRLTGPLLDTPLSEIQDHVNVNAYGPLVLFRSTLPLLRKSSKPKFASITSAGGSFAGVPISASLGTFGAYSASKALANFFIKWLSIEQPDIITTVIHPGLTHLLKSMVETDMGKAGFAFLADKGVDLGGKTISTEDSALGIKNVIETATADGTGARFLAYDGSEMQW